MESIHASRANQGGFFDTPLGQYLSNPFGSTTLQANTLWIALGTSFGTMLVVTILFSLVRPHNSVVYAPKRKIADTKHQPPAIGTGVFSWVKPIQQTKEDLLIEKVGLDAAVFLRFLKMCRNMFGVLSLVGCLILIPVHVSTTQKQLSSANIPASADSVTAALAAITPLNVTGLPLWSHVAASYAIDIVVMIFLWLNCRAIVRLKQQHFASEEYRSSLHSRSVWLNDIPAADRSDSGIQQICQSVQGIAAIPEAAIARKVKELPELIKQHSEAVRELESVLAKYLKNPDKLPINRPTMRPHRKDRDHSGKVDAIDYLTHQIKNLEIRIKDMRTQIDKSSTESYGFATYAHVEDAHSVAKNGRKQKPHGVRMRLAPRPHDLIWENLNLPRKTRKRKRLVLSFWIFVLTLIYIAPNAGIAAFLSNLSNLAAVWPAFATTYQADPGLWQFVQAVLSPALLSLIYLLLPILFRRWSASSGDLTKTQREQHVIQKLYSFFVFNNLIVFSIFSTLFGFILKIIGYTSNGENAWKAIQDSDVTNSLLKSLCAVSNFWLIWLIQRNLGAAIDLAQLINLIYKWFVRTFMAPTPRQSIEWTAPPPFDYANYYNWFLFYATVALCFATVQPLVLLVTFVYFLIDTWLKKYLLLYIFITKTESGGQFWNIIYNRILFATFMANCVAALVIKGCWGQWGGDFGANSTSYYMMGSLIPLPLMLLAFKVYCSKAFHDPLNYVNTSRRSLEAGLPAHPSEMKAQMDLHRVMNRKFRHPALTKKLIKPMVHARAQHLLQQIYSGRLNDDSAFDDTGDIEMTRIKTGPGAAIDTSNMFRVVGDNNLDFREWKNNSEFADQFGGNGELYGRPEDLASERSKTPLSMMDSDDGFSRAATPQPFSRSGTPQPLGGPRQVRPGQLHDNPSYNYQTQETIPQLYQFNNDSQRSLLSGAAHSGYAPVHTDHGYNEPEPLQQGGIMSVAGWRPGGSGYVGVSNQVDEEDIAYEAYRPHIPQGTSYRGYRQ